MVRVTELVSVVTVLPALSCTVTMGWVANAMPLVVAGLGAVVKASLAAVRTMTGVSGALPLRIAAAAPLEMARVGVAAAVGCAARVPGALIASMTVPLVGLNRCCQWSTVAR